MKINGFSLVELSIVLVILGLLTGGILAGQSLIRAAELRGSIQELSSHTSAIYTFRDKYFAMPGDMTNATAFWGIAAGSTGADTTCRLAATTDGSTCDGDGDGQVSGATTGSTYAQRNEYYRFWQHLANAGLIKGNYTGAIDAGGFERDVNVPSSRIDSSSFWMSVYSTASAGNAFIFSQPAGNTLRITPTAYNGEECWNVDTKLDDGKPNTGKMMAYKGDPSALVTTRANVAPPGDADAEYNLTLSDKICNPWMYY